MPRRKLSEYRSKEIVLRSLGETQEMWSVNTETMNDDLRGIKSTASYVVKVDQATKGRFKKGLVALDVKGKDVAATIKKLSRKGFTFFIVEPYASHRAGDERYVSATLTREGIRLSYSHAGGIDIEDNAKTITTVVINTQTDMQSLSHAIGFSVKQLKSVVRTMTDNHFVFLEINPYVVDGTRVVLLDCAVEVDDAGSDFTTEWSRTDIREPKSHLSVQERVVRELDEGSAASFNLSVINPDGSIFLLLSGGGASVVIADDVYNKGFGAHLANYGEYSGNPSLHETHKYTSQILDLVLGSSAPKKVLFIGGAVANFTDIAITFAGVIDAIDEKASQLAAHDLTVYVRRGGPNQEKGLKNIEKCLRRHGIFGGVYDPSVPLGAALDKALAGVTR